MSREKTATRPDDRHAKTFQVGDPSRQVAPAKVFCLARKTWHCVMYFKKGSSCTKNPRNGFREPFPSRPRASPHLLVSSECDASCDLRQSTALFIGERLLTSYVSPQCDAYLQILDNKAVLDNPKGRRQKCLGANPYYV